MAAKYKLKENTEKCTIKNIKDWLSILNKKKYDLSCKWIKYIVVNVEVNKFQKKKNSYMKFHTLVLSTYCGNNNEWW